MVDFYGEKKLAYFATMRDSALLSLGISRSTPELKKLKSPPPQVLSPPHDLAPKHYVFDVWATNGTLDDVHVQIEVRMYDIETGALVKERRIDNQALSSNRATEILEGLSIDEKTSVQAIMRDPHSGRIIARASDWPQPLKYVTLSTSPDVSVSALDGKVEVRSRVPVKGVVVSVPDDREVGFEDNGVDVFPGDVYTIYASGLVNGDEVGVRYYGSDFSS
jgi:beta-mannosidase